MADLCCQYSFGSVTVNGSTPPLLRVIEDGIVGLDGKPIRRRRDPASREDGANVFSAYFHGRVIVFRATMVIDDDQHQGGLTTEYLTAYNSFEASIITALEALLNTPTNLSFTPTGGSADTVSCVYGDEGGEVTFTGPMINRLCTFTLIEADSIIT